MSIATLLSYGMGVESTCILVRWIVEPETRPCPLDQLIVITAQVGDEYANTGRDVELHVLPLLRKHQIRYVQVARHGHLEAEGITVLDDSRLPERVFLDGDFKLSDELKLNGTVPQYAGVHRCALKFKAWVIEEWLRRHISETVRHAIGYNSLEANRVARSEYAFAARMAFGFSTEETSRVTRSQEYDSLRRLAFYPLVEWGWTRGDCQDYLRTVLGVEWKKSACVYCPFNRLEGEAVERHRTHADQVAAAMVMEHVALALNPRASLYKNRSLIEVASATRNTAAVIEYRRQLDEAQWATYRVRRIFSAKGRADRAVERLQLFNTNRSAIERLAQLAEAEQRNVDCVGQIPYVWRERRTEDKYPCREEFLTAAPATVDTKARYGLPWFEERWASLQMRLF